MRNHLSIVTKFLVASPHMAGHPHAKIADGDLDPPGLLVALGSDQTTNCVSAVVNGVAAEF